MNAILTWIKNNAGKHVEAIVIAGALVLAGRVYLQEHDARLKADAEVKTAQSTIADLQAQQNAVAKDTAAKLAPLQAQAKAVQTPAQAVAAVTAPSWEPVQLQAEAIPDAPERVSVEALPLFQNENECQQNAVNLTACQKTLDLQKQIDGQKDAEIAAYKKRPSFLSRLGHAAKVTGCAALGGAVGGLTKTPQGAAIGAGMGAAVCQAF